MKTPRIEENEYTSHEALKEWEAEKDQNTLTQNIVALLGIHGMHCKFYKYQDASHITKAFENLIEEAHQAGIDEAVKVMEEHAQNRKRYNGQIISMIDRVKILKALQNNK